MNRINWERVDRVSDPIPQGEIEQTMAEMEAWDASPEGQKWAREWAETKARQDADPNRLSNRLSATEMALRFAQAVQAIWDETGKPCSMTEAGVKAGMDSDEMLMPCLLGWMRGLIRHPVHPDDPMLEATNLYEPGVG